MWLPSSGGRECLINYSSNVLCYGRVRILIRPVWPFVVAETCRDRKIWNVLIKIHYFLEHLLVFLQTVLQDGRLSPQDRNFLVRHFVVHSSRNVARSFLFFRKIIIFLLFSTHYSVLLTSHLAVFALVAASRALNISQRNSDEVPSSVDGECVDDGLMGR
jgi:hypothetical protein